MTFLQRGVSWRYIQNEDYFATAVRGVYEEPQNGVIAAKELLIRDDIPVNEKNLGFHKHRIRLIIMDHFINLFFLVNLCLSVLHLFVSCVRFVCQVLIDTPSKSKLEPNIKKNCC